MPGEEITLKEEHRSKLDSIVADMEKNGEKPEDIQFVVDDFKSKYGVKKKELTLLPLQSPLEGGTSDSTPGASVPSGIDFLSGDVNSNIPAIPQTKPIEVQQPLMAATSPLETTAKDIANIDPNIAQKQEELNPKKEALGRGIAKAGSLLLQSPTFAYDAIVSTTNYLLNKPLGLPSAPTWNELGKADESIYKTAITDLESSVQRSNEEKSKRYDQEINQYLFGDKKNISKGLDLLSESIIESVPTSLALAFAAAQNPTAAGAIGTAAFGADSKRQLDEKVPDMPEDQKMMWSSLMGGTEMAMESLGLTKLGPMFSDILKRSGKEAVEVAGKEVFDKTVGKIVKQYMGVQAEEVLSEMGNTWLQNVYAKASGLDENRKLMDGVWDSGLTAFGQGAAMTTPTALLDIAVTKQAKAQAQKIKEQKEALSVDLQNPEVSDAVKQSISNKLKDLNEEEANLAAEENDLIKDLDETQQARLSQLSQKAKGIEAAMSDELVSEESKKALQTDLDVIDDEVQTVIKESKKKAEQMAAEAKAAEEDISGEVEMLSEIQKLGFATPEQESRLKELQSEKVVTETGLVEGEKKSEPIDLGNEITETPKGDAGSVGVGGDVGATTKALEEVAKKKPNASITFINKQGYEQKVNLNDTYEFTQPEEAGLKGETIKGFRNQNNTGIIPFSEVAEAYHKAKKDGSNPELVKAVEQSQSSQPLTEVEGGVGVGEDVEATAKKIVGESAFDKLKKEGYTIEKGKFDSDAYASFFGLHTGVQADEFANAGLRLVKPSEKIKVYRGKGKNVSEGENEGVTWVAEDKKVAENYSNDGNVEEIEVTKPKNPFPNPTNTIHVKGSDVANKLRLIRDRLFEKKELTREQALESSKAIDNFESAAGESSELYSTKTNKKGVSAKYVKALQLLGFDGIVQKESYNSDSPFTATKTGNETNTYGIFKAVDPSLKETTKAETPTTNTGVEEGSGGVGEKVELKDNVFYHGTPTDNAESLISSNNIDLNKFGSEGAKNRAANGLLGKGLYLTNSKEVAKQFGEVLKVTLKKDILNVSDFSKTKEKLRDWYVDYINKKRANNKAKPFSKEKANEYFDSFDNQYDEEYVQALNDYAKENGYGGVKHNDDITVIWDNSIIDKIEKDLPVEQSIKETPVAKEDVIDITENKPEEIPQKEIKERRNVDAPLLAKSLGEALSKAVEDYKANQEILVALENKYFEDNGLTKESFGKLDDTEKSKIIKDAVEWKKNNPDIVSEVKKSLTEETKAPKQKPKDELIDTEEETVTDKENDTESIKKLDTDIELLKGFSKKDIAEKKFVGMIERAYKMKEEGKITRKKYTEYKNKAKQILGGKHNSDINSTEAKLAITSAMNKVKEKLLGQGYEKLTLSSVAPVSPKTVADIIDLATYIAHKSIDAGKSVIDAVNEGMRIVKLSPVYKRLVESKELNEKDLQKAINDNVSKVTKEQEKEQKEEKKVEPDIAGEKQKEELKEKKKRKSTKSLSKNLSEAVGVSKEAKEIIKKNGLDRDIKTHKEAFDEARKLIDTIGAVQAANAAMDSSIDMAGNVRSGIFAHVLNDYLTIESESESNSGKEQAASAQAELMENIEKFTKDFEKLSTEAGRIIGAIGEFYKMSPLGIKKKMERDVKSFNAAKKAKMKSTSKIYKETLKDIENAERELEKNKKAWNSDVEDAPKENKKTISDIRKRRAEVLAELKTKLDAKSIIKSIIGSALISGVAMKSPEHAAMLAAASPIGMSNAQSEQIKLIGELAKTYIDEGVLRASELFKKLRKDLKPLGIKLTKEDISALKEIEIDGKKMSDIILEEKSVEELEQERLKREKKIKTAIDKILSKDFKEKKVKTEAEKKALSEKKKTVVGQVQSFIKEKTGKSLTDEETVDLMNTEIDGKKMSDIILEEKAKADKIKALERAFKKKDKLKEPTKVKKEYEKMLNLYDNGALEDARFENAFYEKFGLMNADSKEVQDKFKEFSKKIHAAPGEILKNIEKTKFLNWLQEARQKSYMEAGLSYWYANILSSYETHFRNIEFNSLTSAITMPSLLAQKAFAKGNYKEGMSYFTQLFKDFGESINEGKAVLKTGNPSRFEDVSPQNAIERSNNKVFKKFVYPSRGLRAADAAYSVSLYNIKQKEILSNVIEEKAKEEGLKLSTEKKEQLVNEALGYTKERVAAAESQSEKDIEVVYGKDWKNNKEAVLYQKIRKQEIIEQSRPLEARQEARAWAKKALLTNKPEGAFGVLSDAINLIVQNIPVIRKFIPFVNIGLNISNQIIERSPIGLINAYRGKIFFGNNDYSRELSPDEIKELKMKAYNYTVAIAMVGITAALKGGLGDDDDNADFIVTGKEGGYFKNQALQKGGGLKPFTVYLGGKDGIEINYLNTPMVSIFAPIGYLRDALIDSKNKTNSDVAIQSVLNFLSTPINMANMKGLNDILKYANADELEKTKKETVLDGFAKFGSSLVPYSGLLKSATGDVKGLMSLDDNKAVNSADYLYMGLPFDYLGEKKIDVLGRPIKEQFSVPMVPYEKNNWSENGEVDKYYKVFKEKNYDVSSKFVKSKTAYTDEKGEFEMTRRQLNDLNKIKGETTLNILNREVSKGQTLFDYMSKMSDDDFKKSMDLIMKTSTSIAKIKMFIPDIPKDADPINVYARYRKAILKDKSEGSEALGLRNILSL